MKLKKSETLQITSKPMQNTLLSNIKDKMKVRMGTMEIDSKALDEFG